MSKKGSNDFFNENKKEKLIRLVKVEIAHNLAEHGINFNDYEDKIDFEALVDEKLSLEENVERILKELTVIISKEDYEKMRKSEYEEIKKIFEKELKRKDKEIRELKKRIKQLKESRGKVFEELKELKEKIRLKNVIKSELNIDNYDVEKEIKSRIDILLNSEKINGLIILGQAGIGKSSAVRRILSQHFPERKVMLIKNRLTARAFWNALKSSDENTVIVLDDIMEYDKNLLGMLLSATDTEKVRTITYYTQDTTEKGEVSRIFFKGKVILISNDITGNNEIIPMLEDRCIKVIIVYDRTKFLKELDKLNLPKAVVDYIKSRKVILNYRLLLKLEAINRYKVKEKEKIRLMLNEIIHSNHEDYLILNLISRYKNIETCARIFMQETGKSRRTFYYRYAFLRRYGVIKSLINEDVEHIVSANECKGSAKVVQNKCNHSAKVVQSVVQSQKQELEGAKSSKNDRSSVGEVQNDKEKDTSPQGGGESDIRKG